MKIKSLTFGFLLSFVMNVPVFAEDFEEGLDAIYRTDYPTALAKLRPLAEQGHAAAQYNIGVMYEWGDGVPQDNKQAVKWYKRAAEGLNKDAQNNLGAMYSKGEGVEEDYVEAHKWFSISAANGSEAGRTNIEAIEKRMTREQINEAKKLAKKWMATHPKR